MMGISVWQLLIVLAIVVLLFGTRRLRSVGSDLGESIRSFRKAVRSEDNEAPGHDADGSADTGHRYLTSGSKQQG